MRKNKYFLYLSLLLGAVLLYFFRFFKFSSFVAASASDGGSSPKGDAIGIRSNNWFNIKYNKNNNWVGQIGYLTSSKGHRYAHFDTAVNGFRAALKLIKNKISKGLNTPKKLITDSKLGWSPAYDGNNTSEYLNVIERYGVNRDETLNFSDQDTIFRLCQGMVKMEIGHTITKQDFDNAFKLL